MRSIWFSPLLLALAMPAAAQEAQPNLKLLAASYIQAQEAVYEKGAGPAQLDALMNFYAPEYIYYHPQFGAKSTGLDNVRRGTGSHMGESVNTEIKIKGIAITGNMVSLALEENFTIVETGKRLERPRMIVLTFKGDKIVQRVDM